MDQGPVAELADYQPDASQRESSVDHAFPAGNGDAHVGVLLGPALAAQTLTADLADGAPLWMDTSPVARRVSPDNSKETPSDTNKKNTSPTT